MIEISITGFILVFIVIYTLLIHLLHGWIYNWRKLDEVFVAGFCELVVIIIAIVILIEIFN